MSACPCGTAAATRTAPARRSSDYADRLTAAVRDGRPAAVGPRAKELSSMTRRMFSHSECGVRLISISRSMSGGKAEMTDTVFRVEVTAAEAEHRAHLRRAVVASTVGTAIELYDFLIYSTMTGLVFGKVFFSGSWLRAEG